MKTFKKLTYLVLLLIGTFSLISCHGVKKFTNEFIIPDNFDTSKNYTITFWSKNDTNLTQYNIYLNAIKNFEALYPNIKVEMSSYTDYKKIYEDVLTNIQTKTTPNVCISYPDHVATYLTGNNIVVPLDDLINNEKYGLGGSEVAFDTVSKEEMVDKFLEECKINDKHYLIPFVRSTEALYYNADYLSNLGYEMPAIPTWDFIFEVCEKAMQQKEKDQVLIPLIYKSTDNMMIQMLKQKGFDYTDNNGKILMFNDNTKSILEQVKHAVEVGNVSTFKISSYPGNEMNRGQCIFGIDSTAGATWMGTKAPNMDIDENLVVDFQTGVTVIPQYDVDHPTMISQGPSICIFNKDDSQEVLASWLFAQYLLTNDVQIKYTQTEGYLPVTKKALESDTYKDYLNRMGEDNNLYYDVKIKATKLLLDNINNTFITPVFNGSASVREAAGALIEGVVNSVRTKQSFTDDYYDNLYNKVTTDNNLTTYSRLELGKMPSSSIWLIGILGTAWIFLGLYVLKEYLKRKKKQ